MTLGEKIEQYRKKLNLTQEELGNKLFVSRQTVSQWENNQTFPTTDNLLRLCDIFNVTMNDFFDNNASCDEKTSKFAEKYRWQYSKEDLREVYRRVTKKDASLTILLLILEFSLAVFFLILKVWIAFIFMVTFFASRLIALYRFNIMHKRNCEKVIEATYNDIYEVCLDKDDILVTVLDTDGKMKSFDRIYLSSIEGKWNTDNLFIIQFQQRKYIINKKDLIKDSKLASLLGIKV